MGVFSVFTVLLRFFFLFYESYSLSEGNLALASQSPCIVAFCGLVFTQYHIMVSGYTNVYQHYTNSEVLDMLEGMEDEAFMEGSDDDLQDNLLER